MPTYCYASPTGEVVERVFPMGKAPKTVKLADGSRATRSFHHEAVGVPPTKGWPLTCIASGVHVSQAQQLRDYLKQHGVPTEVTAGGDPVYRDTNHRRRALQVRGMFDRASFN